MKPCLTITIVFLTVLQSLYSQEIKFKHISGADGLISNTVNAITQDSDGFMWFGTPEGLCRYDGYAFKSFVHDPSDVHTLSNNIISCLIEDSFRNLWVGTRNGICKISLNTYEVERVAVLVDSLVPLPIQSLMFASDGQLYVGVDQMGLYSMDTATFEVQHYVHLDGDSTSIVDNTVFALLEDEGKDIWVGTQNGLDVLHRGDGTFSHVLKETHVQHLYRAVDGSISIGIASMGDFYYSVSPTGVLVKKKIPLTSWGKDMVPLMVRNGDTWISVKDKGLFYAKKGEKMSDLLAYNKHDFTGVSSNSITNIYEDKWGNVWFTTHDAGVNLVEKKSKAFVHVRDNFREDGLCNNNVRSVFQDSDGVIWIGTKVGGSLSQFHRESLTFTHYKHDPNDASSLSNDLVFCITEHVPGELWVGTSNGLNLFDKASGESIVFYHDDLDANSISSNNIYAVLQDDKDLLVGHLIDGLDVFDIENKSVVNYHHTDEETSITSDDVRILFRDHEANIWVGTLNGLNLFDKEAGTFRQFLHNPNDSLSISDNYIQGICEDLNHNLWIGTNMGVNLWNREEGTFTVLTRKDGLSGNSVKGILSDDYGNLWITTNNGLSHYNTRSKRFKNFTLADGLQGNEFSSCVVCGMQNGELLFGGNNGFNIFHPDNIIDNDVIPEVYLLDFKLFNKTVDAQSVDSPLSTHISQCKEITLSHKQSVMTFEYVALNYTSPEKNQYAYKMEGFEDDWNYVGTKREATYTNLDAGTYTFRVRAANNDGYWNDEGTSVTIRIRPPVWLSMWAYIVYGIVLVLLVIMLRSYTIKQAKKEKDRENDQQNLRFFINVSHEFRTPLTMIINPVEKLLSSDDYSENKDAAKTISRSANKLLHLINQLLDFRKMDMGSLPLLAVETDIVELSNGLLLQFKPISEEKNITLDFYSSEKKISVWFDPDKYEKILNNLLSNAMKFTDVDGHVGIRISRVSVKRKEKGAMFYMRAKYVDYVELRVEDTGCGLTPKEIENVFERFYSSDESKSGIGIGLNYTKSLVELHGGHVLLESVAGEGSSFIVRLPLGKSHLKSSQLSHKEFNKDVSEFETSHLTSLQYDIASIDETVDMTADDKPRLKGSSLVVLIVEDNKQLRQQLKDELKGEYTVKEAVNGEAGLEKVKTLHPDIVISDVMMPVMNGIDMCAKIKTDLDTCHIPVILLTAKSLVENKIEGFETGADDYISKPFSMPLLKIRVKNLVYSRRQLKEHYSSVKTLMPAKNFTSNNLDETFLDKMTKLVLENLSDPDFNQQQLEEKMAMSRSGLYKKVNQLTGLSTSVFIRNVKLKYAAEMLMTSSMAIKEVAYSSGFSSPSYFNTSFKKLYGKSPAEYAKERCVAKGLF